MRNIGEKVGEMFMVGFMEADPMLASDLIRRHHVGGIILFSRNLRNAAHAAEVCGKLQQLRREVSDSPLFIAVDQEGGAVARITGGVTVFPVTWRSAPPARNAWRNRWAAPRGRSFRPSG